MSTFDRLFVGNKLCWPGWSPLKVLVCGSPGSGKSTLALQLACLGRSHYAGGHKQSRRCVLYYVVDDFPERIREKVHAFGLSTHVRFMNDGMPLYTSVTGTTAIPESARPLNLKDGTCCFFLINYSATHDTQSVAYWTDQLCQDIAATEAQGFDEWLVVVDPINALTWKNEDGDKLDFLGSEFSSGPPKASRSDGPVAPEEFARPKPTVVFLVDESDHGEERDPFLASVCISPVAG